MTRWSDLSEPFEHIVFRDGVKETADRIPTGRMTVYRLINGATKNPSTAVRAGIERIVQEDQSKDRNP